MACQDIREDAQAYLDNELSPARRAQVEGHLAACAECRKVVDELRAVSAVLGAWSNAKSRASFRVELEVKLAEDEKAPKRAAARDAGSPHMVPAAQPAPRRLVSSVAAAPSWIVLRWKPMAAAAMVLLTLAAVATVARVNGKPTARAHSSANVLNVISSGSGETADAASFATVVAKRTIAAQPLDAARVTTASVISAYLAGVDSAAGKSAACKMVNLLASDDDSLDIAPPVRSASVFGFADILLAQIMNAPAASRDHLLAARRYEFQGRLKEALGAYVSISTGPAAGRARLAEGALRLRLGDIDGAETALAQASKDPDMSVSALADEFLVEVQSARAAARRLAVERAKAVTTAVGWNNIALLEVQAYDFRNAASSFMKAASAAGPDLAQMAREASFRSAWCEMEAGQISTGIYGFKSIAQGSAPSAFEYSAAIEQAVGLARIGQYAESVAVCKQLVKLPAPAGSLEALAYFQQGSVELRDLKDASAAADSLGRVASAGQGNLSYAAQVLLQENAR